MCYVDESSTDVYNLTPTPVSLSLYTQHHHLLILHLSSILSLHRKCLCPLIQQEAPEDKEFNLIHKNTHLYPASYTKRAYICTITELIFYYEENFEKELIWECRLHSLYCPKSFIFTQYKT